MVQPGAGRDEPLPPAPLNEETALLRRRVAALEQELLRVQADLDTTAAHTDETLRASEERWRSLAENAPVVIITLDANCTVSSVNKSITGRPVREYLGRKVLEFLHPDYREPSRALLESILAGGPAATGEFPLVAPDGAPFWFQVGIAPLSPTRPGDGLIVVATDINERRRTGEALKESNQRFRDIVQSLGDWVWEADTAGRLTYSSPQIEGLFGYTAEEMLGKTPVDTISPEDRAGYLAGHTALVKRPRPFRDREVWHLHRDGRRVCISVSGVPIFDAAGGLRGYRGVAHDVTTRLREQAEVQHARRVESLGVLAGGIAHDFNNLLTAILGNAELALAELPEGAGVQPLVAQIQAAGQHAAQLTHQMLAYAGRGHIATQSVDVAAVVREMAQLLAASIPKKVELALHLDEGQPAVEADPAQLRQVVMNLVLNSAEAIGVNAGRIEVRIFASEFDDRHRADFRLGRIEADRKIVCIEIEDSGCGIAHEALGKVFDPFFTTKFTGRGLGLAAVQGIVLRHGGTIDVRSAPGAGATFRVCFPACPAAPAVLTAQEEPPAPASPPAPPGRAAAGGVILLVDDEEPVRTMAARMLKALGFEVLAAADGREAVTVAAAAPALRAVLLDLTMPHMDGRETFHELRRLQPELPVILCSGYDILESADRFAALEFSAFLQKPYRLDDLSRALRRALGS